jgi:predicted exporter
MSSDRAWARLLNRRRAVAVWLACVLAAVYVTARTTYVADLSAFLPSTPTAEQAVLLDQLRSGIAARLVLIGIEGGSAEARSAASLQLAQSLRGSGAFDTVNNGDTSQWQAAGAFLFEHRYLLSPAVDAQRFTADGLRAGIDETLGLLGTPAGAMVKPTLLRDPTGETVRMGESMLPAQAPRSEGGVWVSRVAARAVIVATTRAEGSDLDSQERALNLVRTNFRPYAEQGLRLKMSGAGTFGVSSRAQIKAEVERLAVAGSVLMVGLLLLAFGSLRALATALLPVATGVVAGITAVSLMFGNVHGITLGFGTTLMGEAVDYAIYYLIQARPLQGPGTGAARWIDRHWPTVRLGLWTSLCGFAALVFSGFPGLAQLGVFSMAGLAAAALTTRYVFPTLAPDGAPGEGLRRRLGRLMAAAAGALDRRTSRWALGLFAGAALLALVLLPSPWRGNLSSLSPIAAAELQLDADLRADLGAPEAGALVAVSAPDEAQVLMLAEQAGQRLDGLVAQGVLLGYDSPARLLPSPTTQARRRAALPDAATLTAALAQATAEGPLKAERLGPFIADVQAARTQALLDRAALKSTPLASAIDALLVPGRDGRPWRALLTLQADAKGIDGTQVRNAIAGLPGAQLVDIGQELGNMYSRYLREAMLQALFGALAVVALLALHLRSARRLWQVCQPLAAAVLMVMAGLAAMGMALGILHLVGFLLMVAIGSNYALFFDHLRHHGRTHADSGADSDEDTLASLALANLTTVLSFGLLAWSSIPALHAIGQVVAPGGLLCLLLSAAFISPARARSSSALA